MQTLINGEFFDEILCHWGQLEGDLMKLLHFAIVVYCLA
jgi:hypothetical protein